jgi:hypothetical protein
MEVKGLKDGEPSMGLRVAVVGTSNAVLRDGYVPGLESAPFLSTVRRHCIGGSPSILLPVIAEEMNPSDYDACIIDTCINDDVHFNAKCMTLLDAYEHTLSFLRFLARARCMPLLLAMHELDNYGKKTAASELYRALADRFGCGYYDARWFFSRQSARGTLPLAPLFRDKAHPNAETSLALGGALAKHLRTLHLPWSPTDELELAGPNFRLIRPALFGGAAREVVTHVSSLRTDEFLPLCEGQSIQVELSPRERLCGFLFNSASSDGVLRIQGPCGETTWNVSSGNRHKALRRGLAFISQLVPLPTWSSLSGSLKLELLRSVEGARNVVTAENRPVPRAYLELGALVVRCTG